MKNLIIETEKLAIGALLHGVAEPVGFVADHFENREFKRLASRILALRAEGFSAELILTQLSDPLLLISGFGIAPLSDATGREALCKVTDFWKFRRRSQLLRKATDAALRLDWQAEWKSVQEWASLKPGTA